MQDIIALMQNLTLPAGETTGARIFLDGEQGRIQIYNSSNQLVGQIDTSGIITVFDPTTNAYIKLNPASPPVVLLRPADFGVHTVGTGSMGTDEQTVPDRARLLIDSPTLDSTDRAQITLEHAPVAGGNNPKVFVSNGTTAFSDADLEVFGDIAVQELNAAGNGRLRKSVERALSFGQILATPVALSTTAGTYTAILGNAADFPVKAGESYRVSYWNEDVGGLLVSGSGFATTDAWAGKFQRSTNGGSSWADIMNPKLIGRLQVAAATRMPIPPVSTIYQPAGGANVRWQFVAAKTSGAGTVTSSFDGDHFILIEKLGTGI